MGWLFVNVHVVVGVVGGRVRGVDEEGAAGSPHGGQARGDRGAEHDGARGRGGIVVEEATPGGGAGGSAGCGGCGGGGAGGVGRLCHGRAAEK